MKRFVRVYDYLWPNDCYPTRYKSRYDGVDRAMTRPIHSGMSVAPPDAKAVWLCYGCSRKNPHLVRGGRLGCLAHWLGWS